MQFKIGTKDPITKVLWPEELVIKATGGFTLDKSALPSAMDYLLKGALMSVNRATRAAKVVKNAIVQADATNTATAIKVKKNHVFVVGNYIAKTVGGAAYAITAIDTTNADYDQLTVGTTLGVALTAGDVLFQSSATGAAAAAEANVANGILLHDAQLEEHTTVNVALSILEIKESDLPYAVTTANKTSLTSRFLFV